MAQSTSPTKTLVARCFCKSVHYSITVPADLLPLKVHLCHCSICRYTHGTLCIFHAPLPVGVSPRFISPSSPKNVTIYKHPNSIGLRHFCSTCGCQVGDIAFGDASVGSGTSDQHIWVVPSAIFEDHTPENFQIWRHIYTTSAPGGGVHEWVTHVGDKELVICNPEGPEAIDVPKLEFDSNGNERLRAQCHCGGVSFTVPRPTSEIQQDDFMKKFVSPVDKSKWVACQDFCDDCRLFNGTHFMTWTFVPRVLIEPPVSADLKIGTSKTYASSDDVLRSFCATCGATVFYAHNDRMPTNHQQIVNLSVGILRAPEGVTAESWLTWRAGRMAWQESGKRFDAAFADALIGGMEKWSIEKYGRAFNFTV